MHLFERDCSVQRRHQKVVEIAPAPHLSPETREAICADAVKFAEQIGYVNAGTVEFLLDGDGNHHFIEMNPRIQVEHTVTEEVADVDLVACQMRIASGETLDDLGLSQDSVALHGFALQCRITTEDPSNEFRPDIGMISAYRSASGLGRAARRRHGLRRRADQRPLRLAAGQGHLPRARLHHRGAPGPPRPGRVPGPRRLDQHPVPHGPARRAGLPRGPGDDVVHRRAPAPALRARPRRPRDAPDELPRRRHRQQAQRRQAATSPTRARSCRWCDLDVAPTRRVQAAPGRARPGGLRRLAARRRPPSAVTDTTFRDAHQSLLATRVRTRDLLEVAPHVARTTPELLSLECWGGATYDVALRFLAEDPWERLGRAARGGPEHLPADAAARAQHRRLHALPDRGHRRVRRRGRPHRHRHLPDLRRAQRHQPDAAGDRRGAPVRRGRRRGRPLLHRRPHEPRREALHAGLLPRSGRADRRGRRARPGHQGHGRAAPSPGRAQARHRAARALRPARAPAHPRHRRRPARDAHRGDRRRGRRRRRRRRVDGGDDLAAVALGAGRRDRPLRARDRPVPRRRQRARALLGGRAQGLRAVRGRARPRRPAASTTTRSPAGSSPTCASRPSRSGWGTGSSRSRTPTPPPTGCSGTS